MFFFTRAHLLLTLGVLHCATTLPKFAYPLSVVSIWGPAHFTASVFSTFFFFFFSGYSCYTLGVLKTSSKGEALFFLRVSAARELFSSHEFPLFLAALRLIFIPFYVSIRVVSLILAGWLGEREEKASSPFYNGITRGFVADGETTVRWIFRRNLRVSLRTTTTTTTTTMASFMNAKTWRNEGSETDRGRATFVNLKNEKMMRGGGEWSVYTTKPLPSVWRKILSAIRKVYDVLPRF